MPAGRGALEPGRAGAARDDDGDRRVEPAGGDRLDDRLQVAAAARDRGCRDGARTATVTVTSRRSGRCRSPEHDAADDGRAGLAGAAQDVQQRDRTSPRRDDREQADAHVERALGIVARHAAGRHQPRKSGGTVQPRRSIAALVPSGSTRGRLSVMPPPVMCAMPFTQPGAEQRPHDAADRSGAARAAPRRPSCPSSGTRRRHGQAEVLEDDLARQRIAVGVQAARRQRRRSRRRARSRLPSIIAVASTAPTMKPARSYSPSAVEARHLGGLAAEQRAAVVAAGPGHAADDRRRRRPATAGRWRGSRGRTAARRPARGCR